MAPPPTLVLQNVMLPSGRVADLTLACGKVSHVGAYKGAAELCDCRGCFVLPAAIDMHVHMRGGVQSAKEDWTSGSMSAIAGGVTVVVDQPNTIPPLYKVHVFADRVQDAKNHSYCNFAVNSGVTPETNLESLWDAGAMAFGEIFYAPSSYGDAIDNFTLESALGRIQKLGGLATIHAEHIGTTPDTDLVSHGLVRSALGEAEAVRNVQLLNHSECRLHFCHMSSIRSIDAVVGSVEVTPHHLFLSQEQFDKNDTLGKVNPPLRTEMERKDLWERWETFDVIASDHAPHTKEEKTQNFLDAPSGIPGVETMVPLLLAQVVAKKIDLASVIEKTSYAPARLLGIPRAGFAVGDRADFAIYSKKPKAIQGSSLHSRCGWTPFEGQKAIFPDMVVMNGSITYLGGEFSRQEPIWFAGNGYHRSH